MYLSPTFFIDVGLRTIMRNPFFNPTRLFLEESEGDFRLLDGREGLVVTLGPNTSFFDRPNRSVCRWPGIRTIPRQSPHPIPQRSWLSRELSAFMHIFCGGGDVKFNLITTGSKQQELLLTAGEGNVVEKIDLADLAREGAPPLQFLQPAYLCSSSNAVIQSAPCDASAMSWARAPYVYSTKLSSPASRPATLCLAGRTMVWCETLQPGESRDFGLGNVIAATTNITSRLRPTGQPPADLILAAKGAEGPPRACEQDTGKRASKSRFREFAAATKIFFESIRAREGFLVCELTNRSTTPAYVYVQLNKGALYGGSGFIGLFIKTVSTFIRLPHLFLGH